jgi:hypothetical protein
MKPLPIAGVILGCFVVYIFSGGLLIRGTPPYDAKIARLGPKFCRLNTIIYAPLIWTVFHGPSIIRTPLRAHLEWWGCTFPDPPLKRQGRVYRKPDPNEPE